MRWINRVFGARRIRKLPDYSLWEIGGHSWGEAAWSVLHRKPIRSNIIPEAAHKVINLWGPNGVLRNSRFNTYK